MTVASDGTLLLHATTDNTFTSWSALFRLSPGDSSFEKITADDEASGTIVTDIEHHYIPRDASTIFSWGDGAFAGGIAKASL